MTPEQKREYDYIRDERLGMLCGTANPTQEQLDIAEFEALAWLAREQKPTKEMTNE